MKVENLYDILIDCDHKVSTDTRNILKGSIFFALKVLMNAFVKARDHSFVLESFS